MKKIISLFKRNYTGNRQVYDEVVSGAEWVLAGEGHATIKFDGTCCAVRDGRLWKRYDRKLTRAANQKKKRMHRYAAPWENFDYKPAPEGWEAAQECDPVTGHWPGWVLVGDGPEDQWHREAWTSDLRNIKGNISDGTYELVGPKIQGNPYDMKQHRMLMHGVVRVKIPNLSFRGIRQYLGEDSQAEGIVWHHEDGRMVKIKRKDFGLLWPPVVENQTNVYYCF